MSCSSEKGQLTVIDKGKSSYQILIAENADSLTNRAASELKHYFKEISGCELEVVSKPVDEQNYVIIGKENVYDSLVISKLTGLKRDGYIIKTSENNLLLAGMNSRGNLYAVYTLLEEYLGCMKFPYGEEQIPKTESISLPNINKVYDPSFSYRHVYLHDKTDHQLIDWYRVENLDEWGMYVHTFHKLMSPDTYYDAHPEYYSLVNGRRIKDGQLCLSNPEVVELLKENLRIEIQKKRELD